MVIQFYYIPEQKSNVVIHNSEIIDTHDRHAIMETDRYHRCRYMDAYKLGRYWGQIRVY